MKYHLLAQILVTVSLALCACLQQKTASSPNPEQSDVKPLAPPPADLPGNAKPANRFFCGIDNDIPATIALTSRGNTPLILWDSYLSGAGDISLRRCIEVAGRFQTYHERGHLNYLTAGTVNGKSAICARETPDGDCLVLLELKPGTDPHQVLRKLVEIIGGQSTNVLSEVRDGIEVSLNSEISKLTVNSKIYSK